MQMFHWTALGQENHLFDAIIRRCQKKAVANIPIIISFLSCKLLNFFLLMCDAILKQSSSFIVKKIFPFPCCPYSLFPKKKTSVQTKIIFLNNSFNKTVV